jgi:hypothetical protein
MSQPIGMFGFEDGDGEMIYFETTRIMAIAPARNPVQPRVKAIVRIEDGSYASSGEEPSTLAARYDGLVKRQRLK